MLLYFVQDDCTRQALQCINKLCMSRQLHSVSSIQIWCPQKSTGILPRALVGATSSLQCSKNNLGASLSESRRNKSYCGASRDWPGSGVRLWGWGSRASLCCLTSLKPRSGVSSLCALYTPSAAVPVGASSDVSSNTDRCLPCTELMLWTCFGFRGRYFNKKKKSLMEGEMVKSRLSVISDWHEMPKQPDFLVANSLPSP